MNKKEFTSRLSSLFGCLAEVTGTPEGVSVICGRKISDVFTYGAVCEKMFEANLANIKPNEKRRYTWTSDLSIAEWCGGVPAVVSTCKNAVKNWADNYKCLAEFLLSVNLKAWEHSARHNYVWAQIYSLLYYALSDIVYDYFEGNDEAVGYIYSYLD